MRHVKYLSEFFALIKRHLSVTIVLGVGALIVPFVIYAIQKRDAQREYRDMHYEDVRLRLQGFELEPGGVYRIDVVTDMPHPVFDLNFFFFNGSSYSARNVTMRCAFDALDTLTCGGTARFQEALGNTLRPEMSLVVDEYPSQSGFDFSLYFDGRDWVEGMPYAGRLMCYCSDMARPIDVSFELRWYKYRDAGSYVRSVGASRSGREFATCWTDRHFILTDINYTIEAGILRISPRGDGTGEDGAGSGILYRVTLPDEAVKSVDLEYKSVDTTAVADRKSFATTGSFRREFRE